VQCFCGDVTIALRKKEIGQRHTLPRGPKTGATQELGDVSLRPG
jgi:hypothetical protein